MKMIRIFASPFTGKSQLVQELSIICERKGLVFPIVDTDQIALGFNQAIWRVKDKLMLNDKVEVFYNALTNSFYGDILSVFDKHFRFGIIISNLVKLGHYDFAIVHEDEDEMRYASRRHGIHGMTKAQAKEDHEYILSNLQTKDLITVNRNSGWKDHLHFRVIDNNIEVLTRGAQ